MGAIFRREVKSFFQTPIGYVFLGIFTFLSGFFFIMSILPQDPYTMPVADYTNTLGTMTFTLLFIIPILTMRLMSEERRNGTELLLITSPVSLTEIVIGKYLAALAEFVVALAITLIYPLILVIFAKVDLYMIFTGYVGFFLIGATFIAIGLFASSVTKSQVTAAVLSFCMLLVLWVFEIFNQILSLSSKGQEIFKEFLILNKFDNFAAGLFDINAVIFFISLIGVFLFLTFRAIEKRRWSEG